MVKTNAKAAKTKSAKPEKTKNKAYLKELARLHVELVKLQQWVIATKTKICIVLEGWDGAGKGGAIKALVKRVTRLDGKKRARLNIISHILSRVPHEAVRPSERKRHRCHCRP